MASIPNRESLIVPSLGAIYAALRDYAHPVLRMMMGLVFVPHGMQKLFGALHAPPMEGSVKFFGAMGTWANSSAWVYYIGALEFFGGVCLAAGFLTRVVAIQFVGFMLMAAFVANWPRGWFWTAGGSELPLTWAALCFVFVVHGGGKWSVDRALGREF